MAMDIVKLYVSLLGQFFTLSDVAVASSSSAERVPAAFVPLDSNSLATCHFTGRILSEVVESVAEIEGLEIGGSDPSRAHSGGTSHLVDTKSVLKGLVESVRWRFEEVICESWSKGGSAWYRLRTDRLLTPLSLRHQMPRSFSI
jgi:exocyst complex component 2